MITVPPFAIAGDWDTTLTPDGLIRLVMTPSFAFSNGWSPHTQAGLAGLVAHVQRGMTVLDVGTGSGILAIAAAKLGALHVWATDVHPIALEAARANIMANGVENAVSVVEGSVMHHQVDLAVVSISTRWAQEHSTEIRANHLIVVHDDCSWELGW